MFPRPKTKEELEKNFSWEKDVKAIIKFVSKRWNGLKGLKPKQYKNFIENYRDYQGMEDESIEKDTKNFPSFEDGGTISFSFPERIHISHVAYNDKNQSCSPVQSLFEALIAHGHARGEIYGKEKAIHDVNNHLSHYIICNLTKQYDNASDETKKAIWESGYKIIEYVKEMEQGQHDYKCKCDKCKI